MADLLDPYGAPPPPAQSGYSPAPPSPMSPNEPAAGYAYPPVPGAPASGPPLPVPYPPPPASYSAQAGLYQPAGAYGQGISPAHAPFGVDPVTGQPLSDKSKTVAALLQIFLGGFGVGRFYTGHTTIAVAQIAVVWSVFVAVCCIGSLVGVATLGIGSVLLVFAPLGTLWPFIDGIMLLAKGGTDSQGRVLRA